MDKNAILQKFTGILEGKGYYDATPESNMQDDLGMDSLDTVEVIMEAERDFAVSIPDENAEDLKTVGQVVDYIFEAINQPV